MTGKQLESLAGRVLYEHIGDPVEYVSCKRERLRRNDFSVRRQCNKGEAATNCKVHRGDAAVSRVHGRKHVEGVWKLELALTVNRMR